MSTTRANTSQERHKKRKLMKTGLRRNEKRLLFPSRVEKGRDVHMRRARPAGRVPRQGRPHWAAVRAAQRRALVHTRWPTTLQLMDFIPCKLCFD